MKLSTSLPTEVDTIKNDTRRKEDTSKVYSYSDEIHTTKNYSLTKDDKVLIWRLKRNQNIVIYIIIILSFLTILLPILLYLVATNSCQN